VSGTQSEDETRVVNFRRGRRAAQAAPASPQRPDPDLAAYTRSPEDPAEYRRRQAVNAAVFLFVVLLIGAAIWLADTLADMRRNQDCVLSGRRGCTPVEYDRTGR
jgi:hypothetical protein